MSRFRDPRDHTPTTTSLRSSDGRVDLGRLTSLVSRRFGPARPRGYVPGKTAIRDAVASLLGCSFMRAEQLVEMMVARGFVRYSGEPDERIDRRRMPWLFREAA